MNGILNILKPPGMTSHDVVSNVRKITGIKKVGHTGTLDPGAAGVLPICIGKSTKIVDYLMNDRKIYICEIKFGNKTDTYDKYGKFINEEDKNVNHLKLTDILKALESFKGEITQKPPAFSAIKIGGKRAYDLAREGVDVQIPIRRVTIYDIKILNYNLPYLMLQIECSKGTYIRSICNDIGDILKCGSYMNFLIRTQTGSFNIKNSCILEQIDRDNVKNFIISPDIVLNMKSVYIDEIYESKALNGNDIKLNTNDNIDYDEMVKIYIKPDKFIGIGKVSKGLLKIDKLLV
jgi:tRNA pseudouridine55 synthase